MKLQRIFAYTFLTVALLFVQLGALAHGVSHFLADEAPSQQDKPLPHSKVCDKCVAYAEFGGALNSANPILLLADFGAVLARNISHSFFSAALHAFSSRAPPAFL